MTNSPLVSIVIPCYRDSETLSSALKSLYEQTYSNLEILVINDASPETAEIERVLASHLGVFYIKNTINVGLAATRNVGIKNSKGEYVAFLDADDEWHPRKLELQMKHIAANVAIACDVEEFLTFPPQLRVFSEAQESDIKVVRSSFKFSFYNYLTGASLLAPKALLLKVGGYDESLRSCEDYDLWLRLLEARVMLIHLRLPLYYYRFNISGLSKNVNTISFWELEVMKRHLQRNSKRLQFMLLKCPIWIVWLFRHLVRASTADNDALRQQTLQNARSAAAPHLLYYLIKLIDLLGAPGICRRIFGLGGRSLNKRKETKKEAS
ncbi:glycosyltransferase family 2 protein [Polynucleobacter paneuropaeus]|nr:glycosyltransferase family 2 protein [Polynucleobacter paneuropaeus]